MLHGSAWAAPLIAVIALGHPTTAWAQQQALVAVAEDESDVAGRLYVMEQRDGVWSRRGETVPVVFGRSGVGPKVEGDGRSPEGLFPLGIAFGYAAESPSGLRLRYRSLGPATVCVDDPESTAYNQLIDAPAGEGRDFESAEPMRRDLAFGDGLYEYGVVVRYNPHGERDASTGAGRGSCIFLHVWRGPASPTAGCTAMPRDALLEILAWLDPDETPFLAQGSREYLEDLSARGVLPFPVPEP